MRPLHYSDRTDGWRREGEKRGVGNEGRGRKGRKDGMREGRGGEEWNYTYRESDLWREVEGGRADGCSEQRSVCHGGNIGRKVKTTRKKRVGRYGCKFCVL